ncbi:hypothetical protein DPMN_081101 [Dreissena polymorpha]|uniref:Uncharacterized protein n=1 Tax=Dreissena polymorpha TaxID=45954 RepID=A0A9D3Y6S4_DREPO|nr:hypothetical protein DPMN_081101 [Dreissena polymorpha]
MYTSQLSTTKTDGNDFCMKEPSRMRYSSSSSTFATYGRNESDTSGYLSTSSLDSTEEESRLTVNEDKIMSVWNCWSQYKDSSSGLKCSTPKRTSPSGVLKVRVNYKTGSRHLAHKSRSEGDLHRPDVQKPLDCYHADSLDSGLNNFSSVQYKTYVSQDWKRWPYMTQSTTEKELRLDWNKSKHERLPRYRVTINDQSRATHCAISGFSVDEFMSELLSNVNQEHLASFEQFYDRVIRKAKIERFGRDGSVFV